MNPIGTEHQVLDGSSLPTQLATGYGGTTEPGTPSEIAPTTTGTDGESTSPRVVEHAMASAIKKECDALNAPEASGGAREPLNLDGAWTPVHGGNVDILLRGHPSFAVSLLIGAALPVRNAALLVEMQRYW